jgi:hypothetical protein
MFSAQNIPGVPGEDYPIFALPPDTAFSCSAQAGLPNYSFEKKLIILHKLLRNLIGTCLILDI